MISGPRTGLLVTCSFVTRHLVTFPSPVTELAVGLPWHHSHLLNPYGGCGAWKVRCCEGHWSVHRSVLEFAVTPALKCGEMISGPRTGLLVTCSFVTRHLVTFPSPVTE
ncbi:MAG TPA: hypothetical protein VMW01_10975, partial [Williamwhitmania sp.]|nr:hypothetical protein [Williamwhitmania sp.]